MICRHTIVVILVTVALLAHGQTTNFGSLRSTDRVVTQEQDLIALAALQTETTARVGLGIAISNAVAVAATNLQAALDGVATAGSNYANAVTAAETASRQAFDSGLQAPNDLTLYGQDMFRQSIVMGTPGWLNYQIVGMSLPSGFGVTAIWQNVVLNSDGSLNAAQVPDFGGNAYGPYAWLLDENGNYDADAMNGIIAVPSTDTYADWGPDGVEACPFDWNNGCFDIANGDSINGTNFTAVATGWGFSCTLGTSYQVDPVALVFDGVDGSGNVNVDAVWSPASPGETAAVAHGDGPNFDTSTALFSCDIYAVPTDTDDVIVYTADWCSCASGSDNGTPYIPGAGFPVEITTGCGLTIDIPTYVSWISISAPCCGYDFQTTIFAETYPSIIYGQCKTVQWPEVPDDLDMANAISTAMLTATDPVAEAAAAQADNDALTAQASAAQAQTTANQALVQLQEPDGLTTLTVTNSHLQQVTRVPSVNSNQLVIVAVSNDSNLPMGTVLTATCLDYQGRYVGPNAGWAWNYLGETPGIYVSKTSGILSEGETSCSQNYLWDNINSAGTFPFTWTISSYNGSVTLTYGTTYTPVTNAVPTTFDVSNMIAAAIAAYTNNLRGH